MIIWPNFYDGSHFVFVCLSWCDAGDINSFVWSIYYSTLTPDFFFSFFQGAAFLGCLATQPLDVIKTRMMTQAASNLPPYSSALNCVKDIIATEGVSAFLAGLPPRVCYISPLWGAQFLLNEKFQKVLGERNYKSQLKKIVRGPSPGTKRRKQ